MKNLFTKEELLQFNEMMLQRGMPVTEDGIGYNKADFSACANYFYGLSDAQLSDLAKRLVKYCNTQLGVDKEVMKETAKLLAEIADPSDRSNGISLNVTENGTLISFRYNETFIETIKALPNRRWDGENKNWIVPNADVMNTLDALDLVGADVVNAMNYAVNHPLIQQAVVEAQTPKKIEILTKLQEGFALLKFRYNKDVLNVIKSIPAIDRQWNADFKFWAIRDSHLTSIKENLRDVADFKIV